MTLNQSEETEKAAAAAVTRQQLGGSGARLDTGLGAVWGRTGALCPPPSE